MTEEQNNGTSHNQYNTPVPTWNHLGSEQIPFLALNEKAKQQGFRVKFLCDEPRKETLNQFDPKNPKPELWFDVEVEEKVYTWTISQVSLLVALKSYAPLGGKIFDIQLVPVDEEFKRKNPSYKGRQRYVVQLVKQDKLPNKRPNNDPGLPVTEEVVEERPST